MASLAVLVIGIFKSCRPFVIRLVALGALFGGRHLFLFPRVVTLGTRYPLVHMKLVGQNYGTFQLFRVFVINGHAIGLRNGDADDPSCHKRHRYHEIKPFLHFSPPFCANNSDKMYPVCIPLVKCFFISFDVNYPYLFTGSQGTYVKFDTMNLLIELSQ
jgi:hypothetical protein